MCVRDTSFMKRYLTKQTLLNTLYFVFPIIFIFFIFRSHIFGITNNGDVIYNFFNYFSYFENHGNVVSQNILSGFPVLSSVAGIWFYFVNDIFVSIFGIFHAYGVMVIFNILLAYIFTYLFLRVNRFTHLLSIFGSCAFIFSGQNMLWSETLANANYYFVLPLALYLVYKIYFSQSIRYKVIVSALLGVILGLSWLSSHVQYVVYIHVFSFIYLIFLTYRDKWIKYKTILFLLFSYLVSFVVGFPQIQAILDMSRISARESGVLISSVWQGSYLPQDLLHFIFPFFQVFKIPFSNPNLYIGILPIILIILGIYIFKKIKDNNFYFFSLVYIFCLIYSIKYSPLSFLIHYLPFFNSFREAPRIMFIGNFAISMAIVFILDYYLKNREELASILENIYAKSKKLILFAVVPISILATFVYIFATKIGDFLFGFLRHTNSTNIGTLSNSDYHILFNQFISDTSYSLVLWNKNIIVLILVFALTFYMFRRLSRIDTKYTVIIFTAILLLDIFIVYFDKFEYIKYADYVSEPKSVQIIRQNTKKDDIFRIYSLFPGTTIFNINSFECRLRSEKFSNIISKELLLPNRNMDFNIDSVAGYDNFMPKNISEILNYIGSEQFVTPDQGEYNRLTMNEKISLIMNRANILRMLNVRFIVSHYPIDNQGLSLVSKYKIDECDTNMYIYEFNNVLPRYFVFENTNKESISTSTDFNSLMNELKSNPNKIFISRDNLKYDVLEYNRKNMIEIKPETGYNTITFHIDVRRDSWIYIGNAYLPSWSASINGVPTKIEKLNYAYMGLHLPVGEQKIELRFRIPSRIPFIYHE